MSADYEIQLYSEKGENSRSVTLNVKEDGVIHLETTDWGTAVEQHWGKDDYEFWVDVPSAQASKLLFVLLRDRYSGQSNSTDAFRDFCKKEGIEHEWESWV